MCLRKVLALGLGAGVALAAAGAMAENKGAELGRTVFDLFDRGATSIVAVSSCGVDDQAGFTRFRADFAKVADAVTAELQKMNPDRSRDELALVIGFRLAHLEASTQKAVTSAGCDSPEIRKMRNLFDMQERLAQLPPAGTHTH